MKLRSIPPIHAVASRTWVGPPSGPPVRYEVGDLSGPFLTFDGHPVEALIGVLGGDGPRSFLLQPGGGKPHGAVAADTAELVTKVRRATGSAYLGVNRMRSGVGGGRGCAEDVLWLDALWIDIDPYKYNDNAERSIARDIINAISVILQADPVSVVDSGRGLHPYWGVDGFGWAPGDAASRDEARAVLKWFGELARGVASAHGATLDPVWDLPRVMRVPGSTNHKDGKAPRDTGILVLNAQARRLTRDELTARLQDRNTGSSTNTRSLRPEPGAKGIQRSWISSDVSTLNQATFCEHVRRAESKTIQQLRTGRERHNAARDGVMALVRLREQHHPGAVEAIEVVRREFADSVRGELDRPSDEFQALIDGAVRIVEADPSPPTARCAANASGWSSAITQSRLAERLADEALHDRYRYCGGLGGWFAWSGVKWEHVGEEAVIEEGRAFLKGLLIQCVNDGGDSGTLKALLGFQRTNNIVNVVRLCKGMEGTLTRADEFDADPYAFSCGNGVLDLRTLQLSPYDAALLITKGTDVNYVPGTSDPEWDKARLAFADADTERWCQQYLGTGLVGVAPAEDVMTFWHGGGSNGKSTIIGAVRACLGDYGQVLLPSILGGRRDEHPTDLMDLRGLRLGVLEEVNDGHKLDIAKIKRILGTEKVTARRMRGDPVEFSPTHTLVVTTNYRPVVPDTDHGTWRRLRLVPFPRRFGEGGDPVDRGLRARVLGRAAQEAVLAWLVDGARAWISNGLQLAPLPEAIQSATREWREGCDLIAQFVSECTEVHARSFTTVEDLARAFNDRLPEAAHKWSVRTFSERFEQHDMVVRDRAWTKTHHPRTRRAGYYDLRLKGRYGEEDED
jgi:P4 family phage/plasmid primase-like protien